jgi:hypothetical protein
MKLFDNRYLPFFNVLFVFLFSISQMVKYQAGHAEELFWKKNNDDAGCVCVLVYGASAYY